MELRFDDGERVVVSNTAVQVFATDGSSRVVVLMPKGARIEVDALSSVGPLIFDIYKLRTVARVMDEILRELP